jgi:hypothetical protein
MQQPTPLARLALSRLHLRQAMHDLAGNRSAGPDRGPGRRPAPAWLAALQSLPGIGAVVEAMRSRWARHPLRVVTLVAGDAADNLLRPTARRHPLGLVAGAAVLGGLFAWSRPWRWALTPTLFAGLLPPLLFKGMAQVPVQSWLSLLGSVLHSQRAAAVTPGRYTG